MLKNLGWWDFFILLKLYFPVICLSCDCFDPAWNCFPILRVMRWWICYQFNLWFYYILCCMKSFVDVINTLSFNCNFLGFLPNILVDALVAFTARVPAYVHSIFLYMHCILFPKHCLHFILVFLPMFIVCVYCCYHIISLVLIWVPTKKHTC